MKRRLFLTGPIGCGKSTAIACALGERISQCSGFLTRRYREPYLHFTLESPDKSNMATFLVFSNGQPQLNLSPFSTLGKELLQPRKDDAGIVPYILDEIGGIELLHPDFTASLEEVLKCDVPIIGVLKGKGPASALINTLGLTEEYERAASRLRQQLCADPDTLVYKCGQFDENALRLAELWAEEYLHEELF